MLAKLEVALLLMMVNLCAYAQQYPDKPIRFIVPYIAGGAGDIFARTLGQKFYESMGQTVIIDNRPGANGIIGTDLVAKSPPDGYTIVMGNSAPFGVEPELVYKAALRSDQRLRAGVARNVLRIHTGFKSECAGKKS